MGIEKIDKKSMMNIIIGVSLLTVGAALFFLRPGDDVRVARPLDAPPVVAKVVEPSPEPVAPVDNSEIDIDAADAGVVSPAAIGVASAGSSNLIELEARLGVSGSTEAAANPADAMDPEASSGEEIDIDDKAESLDGQPDELGDLVNDDGIIKTVVPGKEKGTLFPDHEPGAKPKGPTTAELEHSEVIEGLLQKLHSKDELEHIRAGIALRKSVKKSDTKRIVEELRKGGKVRIQTFLVEALGEIRDSRALTALIFELEHGSRSTKRAAVDAMGKIGHNFVVPTLASLLRNNPDKELSKRAAAALGYIKSSKARGALVNSKDRVTPGVKQAIYQAVFYIDGDLDLKKTDMEFPSGQRMRKFYKGTEFLFYRPSTISESQAKPWLLVCLHGRQLQYQTLYKYCTEIAKKHSVALLVPYFDTMTFPDYGSFNIRGERADIRFWEIVDHVTEHAKIQTGEIFFFGFDAGGEFLQRLALTNPERIARAGLGSDKFFSLDENRLFPMGLLASPFAPDLKFNPEGFIKSDIALIASEPEGGPRWARVFYDRLTKYAKKNGYSMRVRIYPYKGKADLRTVWSRSKLFIFGKPRKRL